ncbi:hypothetical protein HJC23_000752 [Cyclotella cryptica]|uniref:Myb-like domain-containing protein n=1 Tax=Cyclotella cryptica TaxID=29204 RepID=A0ABD3PYP7_9STRA
MSDSDNEDDVAPPVKANQHDDNSNNDDDDSQNDVKSATSAQIHQSARHGKRPKKRATGQSAKPGPTQTVGRGRSTSFNAIELRLLSEAFMTVKYSADKKAGKFWEDVLLAYRKLVAVANEQNKSNPEFIPIDSKRGGESLRSCWSRRLQPAVQKFVQLVNVNPPSAEQLRNKEKRDLYYANIRKQYSEGSSSFARNFPKNFSRYMKSYHYLSKHPMFQVEFPREGSKPPPKNPVTSSRECNDIDSDQSNHSTCPASKDSPSPERPTSPQNKPIDHIDDNHSHSVSSVSFQTNNANKVMSDMHHTIQQCLATANEQLKSLMHHQIMTHAPSTVRKKYFEDLYCTMAMEMTNKRRRLELRRRNLRFDGGKWR